MPTKSLDLNEGVFRGQNLFTRRARTARPADRTGRFLEALGAFTRTAGGATVDAINKRNQKRAEEGAALGRQAAADPEVEARLREQGALDHVDVAFFDAGLADQQGKNRAAEVARQIGVDLPETATLEEAETQMLEARRAATEGRESDTFFMAAFDGTFRGATGNILSTQAARLRSQAKAAKDTEIGIGFQNQIPGLIGTDPDAVLTDINAATIAHKLTGSTNEELSLLYFKELQRAAELTGNFKFVQAASRIVFDDGTTLLDRFGPELLDAQISGENRAARADAAALDLERAEAKAASDDAITAIVRGAREGAFRTKADVPEPLLRAAEAGDPDFGAGPLDTIFDKAGQALDEGEHAVLLSSARRGQMTRSEAVNLYAEGASGAQLDDYLKAIDARQKGDASGKTIVEGSAFKDGQRELDALIELAGVGKATSTAVNFYERSLERDARRGLQDVLEDLGPDATEEEQQKAADTYVNRVQRIMQSQQGGFGNFSPEEVAKQSDVVGEQLRRLRAQTIDPESAALTRGYGFEQMPPEMASAVAPALVAYRDNPDNPHPAIVQFAETHGISVERAVTALLLQLPLQ
jgi:hypothetical protein